MGTVPRRGDYSDFPFSDTSMKFGISVPYISTNHLRAVQPNRTQPCVKVVSPLQKEGNSDLPFRDISMKFGIVVSYTLKSNTEAVQPNGIRSVVHRGVFQPPKLKHIPGLHLVIQAGNLV